MESNQELTGVTCKRCEFFKDGRCKTRNVEVKEDEKSCSEFIEHDWKQDLKDCYYTIVDVLKKYCDLEERYYSIIALWILGTYCHDEFQTFPYLFINAMKQSGKSRLLRLISILSNNGKMVGSLTETQLFRGTKGRTLCIDEFEGLRGKGFANLRELLNSGYKRGMSIERYTRIKTPEGEKYEPELFDVYTPIAISNISGMEEVLGDRCISLFLEKSNDQKRTKLMEDYDTNYTIKKITTLISRGQCSLCSFIVDFNITTNWNNYREDTTLTTQSTYTTLTTLTTLYNKINDTNIDGRSLELFFPLFIVAWLIDEKVLEELIDTSKNIVEERRKEETLESKDILLYKFLSTLNPEDYLQFKTVLGLTNQFREYLGLEPDDKSINSKWLGRALIRLKLIVDSRRLSGGKQVIININKSKEKCKLFE